MSSAGGDSATPLPSARAWALLREALALPAAQRVEFAERSCAGDELLKAELLDLIAQDSQTDALLDRPLDPGAYLGSTSTLSGTAAIGSTVDRYRLLALLGMGGMGAVYRAEQTGGVVRQHVALKLIKRGMDSEEIVARFLRERAILAQLEHPNIARLIDGGMSDAGQVWFAMELVDGQPISSWCDTHRLTIAQRIALFLDACAAVQYAHRNLIVHRDLKPGNIFVGADGSVKLLDFGIAKLLTADPRDGEATRSQMRLLTPEYAAPEQFDGGRVTTATDVYQLGLVLHLLVCGHRAQRRGNGAFVTPLAAVFSPRAGTVVKTAGDHELATIAAARRIGPSALLRMLRGDLSRIVQKALNDDPARRYESVGDLVEDLRRFLQGRPILARRDSTWYRARRFIARHKAGIATTALVVVALVGASLYSLEQARRAHAQATRAESVRSFLLELFALNNPELRKGAALGVRELVDLGARRAESGLVDDVDTCIDLLGVVGSLYLSLGEPAAAIATLQRRREYAETRYAADDPRALRARIELAGAINESGEKAEQAQELGRSALASLPASGDGATRALRVDALEVLAEAEMHSGHADAAIAFESERLGLLRETLPGTAPEIALAQTQLGSFLEQKGDTKGANEVISGAVDSLRNISVGNPALALVAQSDIAHVLTEHGRFDEAAFVVGENLALARQVYGTSHPTIANALFQRGQIERMRGASDFGVASFREALAMFERTYGPNNRVVATTLMSLGQALSQSGQHAQAVEVLERANALYLETVGPKHMYAAISASALAKARLRNGDAVAAERGFRDSLEKYAGTGNDAHIFAQAARSGLGESLFAQKRFAEAEPLLRGAEEQFVAQFGAADFRSVETAIVLARCVAALGRNDESRRILEGARNALAADPEKSAALIAKIEQATAAIAAQR